MKLTLEQIDNALNTALDAKHIYNPDYENLKNQFRMQLDILDW